MRFPAAASLLPLLPSLPSLLLAGCGHSTPVPPTPPAPALTSISFTWQAGNPWPVCGSNVTYPCLLVYTLYEDGAPVAVNIPGSSLQYLLSNVEEDGQSHQFQLSIQGYDASGAAGSASSTTTVTVP
jgi:hypothetical protein